MIMTCDDNLVYLTTRSSPGSGFATKEPIRLLRLGLFSRTSPPAHPSDFSLPVLKGEETGKKIVDANS